MTVTIAPKRLAILMALGVVVLLAAHAGAWIWAYYDVGGTHTWRLFNLDLEGNIPSWYSASLLFLGSLGAATNALAERTRWTRYWLALSGIFLYLSLDEAAAIHEELSHPIREFIGSPSILHKRTWILAGVLVVIVFVVVYVPFMRALPRRTRTLLVTAGALYVIGAVGFEFLGTVAKDQLGGKASVGYLFVTLFEEGAEMFGAVLFLFTVLSHAAGRDRDLRIALGGPER